MAQLNSKFDILRGWPHGSAVAEELSLPATVAAANDQIYEGHWVRLDQAGATTSYTIDDELRAGKNSVALTDAAILNEALWGLVIEGRQEKSVTEMVKKVTVLLGGGYVVRLWNDPDNVAADDVFVEGGAYNPGLPVTLVAGQISVLAAPGLASTLSIFGYVLGTATDTLDIYVCR